jgi:hypothetical protein
MMDARLLGADKLAVIGGRDVSFVVLRISLEAQEIVIAAIGDAGIFTAHRRSRLVNGAATGFRVEELADLAIILVLLAAHDPLITVAGLEIFLLEGLGAHVEMLGEPREITLADGDRGIRAAIAGALKAIVVLPHVVDTLPVHRTQ